MLSNYYDLLIKTTLLLVKLTHVIKNSNAGPCSSLNDTGTIFTCKYNNTLSSCINPLEGTEATISCKPFYEESYLDMNPTRLYKCKDSAWNKAIPICYPICGEKRSNDNSNISSDQSKLLDYPWHVGIYDADKFFRCGGTLISMKSVLTAAHCVSTYNESINLDKGLLVASGKYFIEYHDKRDKFSQYSKVLNIKIPERYRGEDNGKGSYAVNIAILILNNSFVPSEVVQPVCINPTLPYNSFFAVNGTVTGWGTTYNDTNYSEELKEIEVSFIPQNICSTNIRENFSKYITADKICGDPLDNVTTVCDGDNGGSLIFKNLIDGRYYITGVAATADGNCDPNQFIVFTSISYYEDFLKNHLSSNDLQSCQLPQSPAYTECAWQNLSDTIVYEPGYAVPLNTKLKLICTEEFYLSTRAATEFYCSKDGHWDPTPETNISKNQNIDYEQMISHANKGFNYIYFILIVAVAVLFVIAVVAVILLRSKLKKEGELRRELKLVGLDTFPYGDPKKLNPELGIADQAELLPYNYSYEFPKSKLEMGKQLGNGAFGIVIKAEAVGIKPKEEKTTVAVKTVKNTADNNHMKALISELKIMIHLGQHLNVVNLLGACTQNITKRELLVIVEYCPFGNLYNFLLRNRPNFVDQIDSVTGNIDYSLGSEDLGNVSSISSNTSFQDVVSKIIYYNKTRPKSTSHFSGDKKKISNPLFTKDLISWTFQVSRGMEYLFSRKIIHGDLAARNILLAENNIVKICDFGLAKRIYRSVNYKKKKACPLPIKWMAIESIRDGVFSTQSDVWSYGILLWELFSLAQSPYPAMEPDGRLYSKLLNGYKMESPPYAPKDIYKIMCDCWNINSESRPSFNQLSGTVGLLLEENIRQHYIDLNDPYFIMNTERLNEGQKDYLARLGFDDFQARTKPDNYINRNVLQPDASLYNMIPTTYLAVDAAVTIPVDEQDDYKESVKL